MSNVISISEAVGADLPDIQKLLAELVNIMESSEAVDMRKVLDNCRALLNDTSSKLLVAKIGDSLVGFINFTVRKTALHLGPSGLIDELIVTKGQRGKGIGRQLVSAAIDKCRQLGCCEIEVSTEKANTIGREFYMNCGFKENAFLLEMHLNEGNFE